MLARLFSKNGYSPHFPITCRMQDYVLHFRKSETGCPFGLVQNEANILGKKRSTLAFKLLSL